MAMILMFEEQMFCLSWCLSLQNNFFLWYLVVSKTTEIDVLKMTQIF